VVEPDSSLSLDERVSRMTRKPDSRVWVRPLEWRDAFYLKFVARGSVIDPSSPDLVYPLQRPADPRLPLKSSVMGVQFGDSARAYPAEVLARPRVTQEEIGGQPVVFLAGEDGEFIQLLSRQRPDGQGVSRFKVAPYGGHLLDEETGSIWDAAGRCSAGPLRGVQFAAIPPTAGYSGACGPISSCTLRSLARTAEP